MPGSASRELERERGTLERQEKKIINDIKKMAKTGQMVGLVACRTVVECTNWNSSPHTHVRVAG